MRPCDITLTGAATASAPLLSALESVPPSETRSSRCTDGRHAAFLLGEGEGNAAMELLVSLGVEGAEHAGDTSFMTHLAETRDYLLRWGCATFLCDVGLLHSICKPKGGRPAVAATLHRLSAATHHLCLASSTHMISRVCPPFCADGTESFQPEQSLRVTEREQVVAAVGERCEQLCFVNCVMERESFDDAITALAASGLRGCLHRTDALSTEPEYRIRARKGDPSDAVTWDSDTDARHASLPHEFVLTQRELVDLATMLLADWLQQVPHHEASMDAVRKPVHMESHTLGGVKGNWIIPKGGWYSLRRHVWESCAQILGGQAEYDYRRVFAALDNVAEAPCEWRALDDGEVMAREAMRAHGAKLGTRVAASQVTRGKGKAKVGNQDCAAAGESAPGPQTLSTTTAVSNL